MGLYKDNHPQERYSKLTSRRPARSQCKICNALTRRDIRSVLKTPARPALPACGVPGSRLVTELFAAADPAVRAATGFSEFLGKLWPTPQRRPWKRGALRWRQG